MIERFPHQDQWGVSENYEIAGTVLTLVMNSMKMLIHIFNYTSQFTSISYLLSIGTESIPPNQQQCHQQSPNPCLTFLAHPIKKNGATTIISNKVRTVSIVHFFHGKLLIWNFTPINDVTNSKREKAKTNPTNRINKSDGT